MVLFIEKLLLPEQKNKRIYQVYLWGIQLSSWGMLLSFPFQGYAAASIVFSTAFILFTYVFSWTFIRDLQKTKWERPVKILATGALVYLVVSSIGPFTLAYIMATHSGDAILFRDAIYTFLHFQYNGYFTLSVFALLFASHLVTANAVVKKRVEAFSILLTLSVLPTLFLSLLWHPDSLFIKWAAYLGFGLTIITLVYFFRLMSWLKKVYADAIPMARALLLLSLLSFLIKMILQTGTIVPSLGNAVFGFRPIIIGFLHLVFLGFISFYILSHLIQQGLFSIERGIARVAVLFFATSVIFNELILLVNGISLMFYITYDIYAWLLWVASICLFLGAGMLAMTRMGRRSRLIPGMALSR